MAKQVKPESSQPVKRTVYPYYSLAKAIEIAEVVKDNGGINSEVSKSLLAQHLKTDETSPALNGWIGAAKLFVLIEGRAMYRLTETAKRYFMPVTDKDRHHALLDMVNGPPLFRSLIAKFDGTRIPPQENMVNILGREFGISDSWQSRVASLFMTSLQQAQLIDSAGFLRYRASMHAPGNGTIPGMNTTYPAPVPGAESIPITAAPATTIITAQPRNGIAVWSYRGIRLEAPETMSMDLWNKLNNYVNVLKPENGSDTNEAGRQQ